MADDLAAELKRIGDRHKAAYVSPWAMSQSGADVPRLRAAVQAALEVHALTALHRHTEPCALHRYRGIADRSRCPDCKVIEWTGCETCRDEYGNPAKAGDCTTRQAITKALLGEKAPR